VSWHVRQGVATNSRKGVAQTGREENNQGSPTRQNVIFFTY
jgi:hypothetical protein